MPAEAAQGRPDDAAQGRLDDAAQGRLDDAAHGRLDDAARVRLGIAVLAVLALAAGLALAVLGPVAQDPAYHGLADRRRLFGIPHFGDVVTNLAFLVVGVLGLRTLARAPFAGQRRAWAVLFAGVALVAPGSAWYHLAPDDHRLIWDRLPMALGFGGLLAGVLGEHLRPGAGRWLLPACVAACVGSVAWWAATGDLGPYALVQLAAVAAVPAVIALFPARYTRRWLLLAGIGCYGLAKAAEILDHPIHGLTGGLLSGHNLKHLLAAAGVGCVALMIRRRRAVAAGPATPPAIRTASPAR